jgi:hypothetical protein
VDISSTIHEHNLQTQVQLMKPSLLLENLGVQVHTLFILANQEIPLDQHFRRKEVMYILDLPWLMSTKLQAYMWNRKICGTHNLTFSYQPKLVCFPASY